MLTGTGDRVFCAGADLGELAEDAAATGPFTPVLPGLYRTCLGLSRPTIAVLNGTAAGGGLELALACDIRLMAAGARLVLPEARLGMGPTFGAALLARLLPWGRAMEAVWTGEPISAAEAERWGLVGAVHEPAELEAAAWDLAGRIAASAPLAVRRMKLVARAAREGPLAGALDLREGPDLYASEDRREGLLAWRERRPPRWRGR
jgi:enoyl-CoA hydratase